ncbi:transposase, partial [Mesorhizobium sp. M00.F.Ca.ET.216.01.1.1]|uniref:transposase n=1 Tax=Mesorhizobium sp. M00.F.Ca.ET.216.01.1.1 TaxID=2500528 RepID=UPI00113BB823
FLLHVLPKGFHRIRHYGLLASAHAKANIARARELLAAPQPKAECNGTGADAAKPSDWRPPCPCCGGKMIVIETFERGGDRARAPPRTRAP